MFESPEDALASLSRVGYLTDRKTATTVYLAGKINKPIMLEGPAGAGKTELAQSVARAACAPLLRLQCYQGINEEKAIGQYDKSLQELFVLLKTKAEGVHDWAEIRREVTGRDFFLAGPSLTVSRSSGARATSIRGIALVIPSSGNSYSLSSPSPTLMQPYRDCSKNYPRSM